MSLHRPDWLNHTPLENELNLHILFPPLRSGRGGGSMDSIFQPSSSARFGSPGNKPPAPELSKNYLINIKATEVERGSSWMTRRLLRPYSPEAILGTKHERPNIITEDVPITLITWGNSKRLGAVSQEPGARNKYVFLTNHRIAMQRCGKISK